MKVRVWVESWELECCTPDAIVGLEWSCMPTLGSSEPWWLEHAAQPVPEAVRALGVSSFDGQPVHLAGTAEEHGLVAVQGGHVAVRGLTDTEPSRFEGRLSHQGHGFYDDLEIDWNLRGVVTGVLGIRYQREQRSDGWVPVAQHDPVPLDATGTNRPGSQHVTYGRGFSEFLVDLET